MKNFPPNTTKVPLKNLCDECRTNLAGFYNTTWYIHFCSIECFKDFLKGYNTEIDDIALEMKRIEDLEKLENDES